MVRKKKSASETLDDLFDSAHEIKHDLDKETKWPKWPTGIPLVDFITDGGIPKGRVTLCYGPPSSGKSTIYMKAAAGVQKAGKWVVWIDTEGAFSSSYAAELGIDVDDTTTFRRGKSPNLEATIDFLVKVVRNENVGMVVVDSVAGLMLKSEIENGGESNQVGGISKKLKHGLKLLQNTMDDVGSEVAICLVAQQYDAIGVYSPGGGTPKAVGGGKAQFYAASLALEFAQVGQVKGKDHDMVTGKLTTKDVQIGQRIRAKVAKTRMHEPFRETQFVFIKDHGIDDVFSMVELGIIREVIEKKGAWFYVPGEFAGQDEPKALNGEGQVRQFFYDNPEHFNKFQDHILSLLDSGVKNQVVVAEKRDPSKPNMVDLTEMM